MNLKIIHEKIHELRGQKVMLDFDLAVLYEVETRILNQSVKRNIEKFPQDFMFRLTTKEWELLRAKFATAVKEDILEKNSSSQIVMMNTLQNRSGKYLPYCFTEHGVTMLASVLKSTKAIDMNIAIVRAFIAIRHFANSHKDLFEQLEDLRKEMLNRIGEHDVQLAAIYDALENLLDKTQEEQDKKENWQKGQGSGLRNNNRPSTFSGQKSC